MPNMDIQEISKLCAPIMEYLAAHHNPYMEICISESGVQAKQVELGLPSALRPVDTVHYEAKIRMDGDAGQFDGFRKEQEKEFKSVLHNQGCSPTWVNKGNVGLGNVPGKEFAEEPWDLKCFTKDFAHMIQLFHSITRDLEFSQPFRMVIDYDPEQLRTSVKTYLPKELHESRIRQVQERWKD